MSEPKPTNDPSRSLPVVSRRTAVKGGFATLGAAAFVAAVSPLRKAAKETSAAEFMQQHYQELSDEDKRDVIARLEIELSEIELSGTAVPPHSAGRGGESHAAFLGRSHQAPHG